MTTTLDHLTRSAPTPSSHDDKLLLVAYGLTGTTFVAGVLAYAIPNVVPVYLAAALWLGVTLAYVLPRSARAINERANIGGAVVAIILSLVFVPPMLVVSLTATAAAAVSDAFEDVSDDFDLGGLGSGEELGESTSDEYALGDVAPDGSSHDDECEETYYDTDWDLADLDGCLLEND